MVELAGNLGAARHAAALDAPTVRAAVTRSAGEGGSLLHTPWARPVPITVPGKGPEILPEETSRRAAATGTHVPTPVVSRAILVHNRGRSARLADGIVVTPSHNPPEDGGFKYNPPTGGPADTEVTGWIEQTANALLSDDLRAVRRMPRAMVTGSSSRFGRNAPAGAARSGTAARPDLAKPSNSLPPPAIAARNSVTGP
jgi:hypothetical protein